MGFTIATPGDLCRMVAFQAREARIASGMTQQSLAGRAGISLSTLKKFETTGNISMDGLARIALALRMDEGLEGLFVRQTFSPVDEG